MFRMKFKIEEDNLARYTQIFEKFLPDKWKIFPWKKNWCRLCVVVLFSHISHVRKLWRSESS